jgi:hypothetical protein
MPYRIVKRGSGYKVCKKSSKKCFSKKPLNKEKAQSQMKALYASESISFEKIVDGVLNEKKFKI